MFNPSCMNQKVSSLDEPRKAQSHMVTWWLPVASINAIWVVSVKFRLTFCPGSCDSPPVVPASSVLLPRFRAGAWKTQRDFALTIGVKLVQRSTERGSNSEPQLYLIRLVPQERLQGPSGALGEVAPDCGSTQGWGEGIQGIVPRTVTMSKIWVGQTPGQTPPPGCAWCAPLCWFVFVLFPRAWPRPT